MTMQVEAGRLREALDAAADELIRAMRPEGYWEGRLSSSALSTATAVSALSLADPRAHRALIDGGSDWLATHQNTDGGWGDTPDSPSNVPTTALALAALTLAGTQPAHGDVLDRARACIVGRVGTDLVPGITRLYGEDRTFAVPILVNCALAGLVPWREIPPLSFELAALPHRWYKSLDLQVVSYALPALIAIGLVLHRKNPTRNPLASIARRAAEGPALRKLHAIQPEGGGFLEAVPLTSFVAMSLIPVCGAEHRVARDCIGFVVRSVRGDGSWAIDSNLSVWVTTNAVLALGSAGWLAGIDLERTRGWLAARQYAGHHPYTNALPGGWPWTHLPGGVPDADDTARAVLALERTGGHPAAAAGVQWLLDLQNKDGGWPTFCRGWGKLPFDKSSPDVTAHALEAFHATQRNDECVRRAMQHGLEYLRRTQRADGSWVPLWFGSQHTDDRRNPVLGTAWAVSALREFPELADAAHRGIAFLLDAQNTDGGWGGARGGPSSIEETAAAVSALAKWRAAPGAEPAAFRGAELLARRVEDGSWRRETPIGLYFASLWYSEQLYSMIWTVDALGEMAKVRNPDGR